MMNSKKKIPVLMYHGLFTELAPGLNPVHISKTLFEKQIKWLAAQHYHAINMDELPACLSSEDEKKYCVISFDDGYKSLYDHARPVLKNYGFTATLYLTTGLVGKPDFQEMKAVELSGMPPGDRPLQWVEIREMAEAGWSIQSHSIYHADHTTMSIEQLKHEVMESKSAIEKHVGKTVDHYAFPFGKYNTSALKAVKEAGYLSAASVHPGLCKTSNDPYRLPRLEMNCHDDLESFTRKIETGFVSVKQKLKSTARNILFSNSSIKDMAKKLGGDQIN